MNTKLDDDFFNRADAFIALANEQGEHIGKGKVSASFLYGAARYNAYIGAINADSRAQMQRDKAKSVEFYVNEYREMLIENLDDYIENYESYMASPDAGKA